MGGQTKKKSRGLSLTDEEFDEFLGRARVHGFKRRAEYLLALIEADHSLRLEAVLDSAKAKILRPSENGAPSTQQTPARNSHARH
jgi:hypothetical protein